MKNSEDGVRTPVYTEGLNLRVLADYFAIACVWAWWYILAFSEVVLLEFPPELKIEPVFRTIFFGTTAITFVLIILLRQKFSRKSWIIVLIVIAVICSPWPSILALYVKIYSETLFALECVAWALSGIASAIMMFFGSRFNSDGDSRQYLLKTSISITIGAAIYFFISAMSRQMSLLVVIVLPLLSIFLFMAGYNLEKLYKYCTVADNYSFSLLIKNTLRFKPATILNGIVYGFGLGVGISLSNFFTGGFLIGIIIAICVTGPLGLVTWALIEKKGFLLDKLEWFQPALCTAILLLMPIGNEHLILGSCCLLALACTYFDIIHDVQTAEFTDIDVAHSPFLFAGAKCYYYFGMFLGWGFMTAIFSSEYFSYSNYDVIFTSIGIVALFGISAHGWSACRISGRKIEPSYVLNERAIDEKLERIAREFELTPRQSEIFVYLAKGRNAPYISEKLVLSNHTVKAHIYRIYQKVDIHSQQELIDLVEKRTKE